MIPLKILNLSSNPNPQFHSPGAAGIDLAANETVHIKPGTCALVPTGIRVVIPEQHEGQLRLRSSMYKRGVVMPNAPGTIDSDYRGEIFVPVRNVLPWDHITFEKGERIAQLVVHELPKVDLVYVNSAEYSCYDDTFRSEGAFGSTNNSDGLTL